MQRTLSRLSLPLIAVLVVLLGPGAELASRAWAVTAQPTPDPEEDRIVAILRSFHPQKGKISLPNGMAELNLPDQFRYLDAGDGRKLLVDIWKNPPSVAEGLIGMIIPRDFGSDDQHSWAAAVSFSDVGFIKDEEPDYAELLKKIQAAQEDANPERVKAGYHALHIIGWAQPPRYDKASKKLYWAKELQSGDSADHGLNYDIRILGRRGSLDLSIISAMDQIGEINNVVPTLISAIDFNEGHRYADFNPKTDKVAPYALAGLIGGGLLLAKVGGLKWLIAALLAAKKFVIIGVLAVAGFFKRLFSGGTKVNTDGPVATAAMPTLPPASPGAPPDRHDPPAGT